MNLIGCRSKIKQANKEKEELIGSLRKALAEVKTLSGMLPICSSCKKHVAEIQVSRWDNSSH